MLLQTGILSFVISFILTPITMLLAPKLGIVDNPEKRKHPAVLHQKPTPRGGGIPILAALLATAIIFIPVSLKLTAIILGAFLIVGIGLVDDRKPVAPVLRLIVNSLAGLIVVASGVKINFVTNPFGGIINLAEPSFFISLPGIGFEIPLLSLFITLTWIVFTTNVVSWSSGVDGQLAGFVPIAAGTIGALALRFHQDLTQVELALFSIAIAGAYLGFLFWSVYPQRIMPGYSGGALAGYLLGILAILSGAKLATAVIVLGIPIMDAAFTVMRRILSGKSPIVADRGHLHHKLIDVGWSKSNIALFYWLVSATLGILVLHLKAQAKFYTIVMLAVLVGVVLVWAGQIALSRQQDQRTG